MRLRGYILLVFLSVAFITMAQPRLKSPEIAFGFHGGVAASSMIFNPSVKQLDILKSPLSGNGGLVFRYAEHKVCALQVECNYIQHGWAEVLGGGDQMVVYTRHLYYIEVPLLMHLNFGKKNFKFFFNLGPQIGYCIADQTKLSSPYELPNELRYKPIDNSFDWGVTAGLGCYYKAPKVGVFQLELRGYFSLGSVYEVGQLNYYKMANPAGVSVNLAYLWEFKKNNLVKHKL